MLAPAGIVPLIADMPAGVEATIRESKDRRLLFILNTLGEPAIVNGVPAGMDLLSGVELRRRQTCSPRLRCCIIELD